MLLVRATERSTGQTESGAERRRECGVVGPPFRPPFPRASPLERGAIEGDSPVL
jgi:hypothetical protein